MNPVVYRSYYPLIPATKGVPLGILPNTFDSGIGSRQEALTELESYTANNESWALSYKTSYDNGHPECVLLLYTEDGVPSASYYIWDGISWRQSSLATPVRGLRGEGGADLQSAAFVGNDIVFTDAKGKTTTLADAKGLLKGDNGEGVIFQFSANPTGPFVDINTYEQSPNNYSYWRWSTDGGQNWTPDGVRFRSESSSVTAGEGVSVDQGSISVVSGGPNTLGGFKVGTGLQVDGSGKLSTSASSESTKVLPNETAMLTLTVEPLRPYRVIRLDTNRLYFLNAGDSPAVLGNWFTGPSIDQAAISFNGRSGLVISEFGDYTADEVPAIDKTTSVQYKFVIDNGQLFIESLVDNSRSQIAKQSDLSAFQNQVNSLTNIVSNPVTGLVKKVADVELESSSTNNIVSNPTTGLVKKVTDLETFSAQKGQPSGLAPLGTASKVPKDFLPDYLPQSKRTWKGVLALRGEGIWYTNNSVNERDVYIVSNNVNSGGYVNILIRENAASNTYNFVGNSISPIDGSTSRSFSTATIPQGWEYQVSPTNIGTRELES